MRCLSRPGSLEVTWGRTGRDVWPIRVSGSPGRLEEQYQTTGPGDGTELTPSYNVAPTNKIYAVVERR